MPFDDYDVYDDYDDEDIDADYDAEDIFSDVVAPTLSNQINTSEIISEVKVSEEQVEQVFNDAINAQASRIEVPLNTLQDEPVEQSDVEGGFGNYNSKMPRIPEDIETFDVPPENVEGEYHSETLLVTKRFKELNYPQIRLSQDLLQHKYMVSSLKALLTTGVTDVEDELQFDILVCFDDGDVVRLGTMLGRNLNNFLSTPVFSKINKSIYLDANTEIKGEMMYALCTVQCED